MSSTALCWRLGLALALVLLPPVRAERMACVPSLVPDAELLGELASAPLGAVERLERLQALYEQAGARPEDISLQTVQRPTGPDHAPEGREEPLANLVITKKGQSDRLIVVGAHLDKVPIGRGIIDNWSGASLASNLYQSLRALPTRHTFVFVGFAAEETGLHGSKAFVAGLGPEPHRLVSAMVNLECLGVESPFLWTNGSTDRLEALAHRVADAHKLPLRDHVLNGVEADAIPFDRAGIPNLTFDGLPVDKLGLIHSEEDCYENIDPRCFTRTYRLLLPFLLALDQELSEDGAGKAQ